MAKSTGSVTKLTPNLKDKRNYIVHERNRKLYLQQGLELVKVHRAIEFTQRAWLKPYIELNTRNRTAAKAKFEQDFFKLMNNAVFGKSMENVRKYQEIQLVTAQRTMDKLVANPRYKYNVAFTDTLTAVSMAKEKIILNKPIYTGFAILDISKELRYRFHYDYIATKYGKRATLLFTDTDSLCYHIKTGDAYQDMIPDKDQWFDCSAYPADHFLHDLRNKKVIER